MLNQYGDGRTALFAFDLAAMLRADPTLANTLLRPPDWHRGRVVPSSSAPDLRTLVAVLRVVHELELTGDLMTAIAGTTSRLRVTTLNPRLRGILARMGAQVGEQVRLAAEAFEEGDVAAVERLERMDDEMTEMSRELFSVLFALGASEPGAIRRAVDLALVARFFQRAADHAVNIGGRVRYMVMGDLPIPHPVRDVVGNCGRDGSPDDRQAPRPKPAQPRHPRRG